MAGAPTKYDAEVHLPILEKLLETKDCVFLNHLPHLLKICPQTLYNWINPDHASFVGEEFLYMVGLIEAKRDHWLMERNISFIMGTHGEGNAGQLKFTLSNALGWKDRQEVDNNLKSTGDIEFRWGKDDKAG